MLFLLPFIFLLFFFFLSFGGLLLFKGFFIRAVLFFIIDAKQLEEKDLKLLDIDLAIVIDVGHLEEFSDLLFLAHFLRHMGWQRHEIGVLHLLLHFLSFDKAIVVLVNHVEHTLKVALHALTKILLLFVVHAKFELGLKIQILFNYIGGELVTAKILEIRT